MKTLLPLILLCACPALALAQDLDGALGREGGVTAVLWEMAGDEDFAAEWLAAVDERQLVLADTLLSVLRMTEPQLRPLLPDMHVVSDFAPPLEERQPDWARVRWVGVRWMKEIAARGGEGRDVRLVSELDQAMAGVDRPQRGEMGGLVEILVLWWADRGLDPRLTHHRPPRDPAAAALARAAAADRLPGLGLLREMDTDPVVRERVLGRLSQAETAWLTRDFMVVVEVDVDSLEALGIPPRRWDARVGIMRGHAALDLRRLALDALDQCAPPVVAPEEDFPRRVARLAWWDDARFEARYWPDPREAPDFSDFLAGLDRPEADGGRELNQWVRLIHLQTQRTRQRVLEQLGPAQQGVVAELMGLARLDRVEAAEAGFRLAYARRPIIESEGAQPVTVAIDWQGVQRLIREMLAAITGVEPPPVLAAAPEPLAQWWADWWAGERDDAKWYRGPLPPHLEMPETDPGPRLTPRRGRVD